MQLYKYTIQTPRFDASAYGDPWIAVADFSACQPGSKEPVLDFYGATGPTLAGYFPDDPNLPHGQAGRCEIYAYPGTIICHGQARNAASNGGKPGVSRVWYFAGGDGELVSLLGMGGFDFAYTLSGEPNEARLDRFRTTKAIERLDDGGAGMVGTKPAALLSPETLTFGDFQLLSRSLCMAESMAESAVKLHSEPVSNDTPERTERRARLVDSYARELLQVAELKSKLRRMFCGN